MVALNRAIADAMVAGPAEGLARLDARSRRVFAGTIVCMPFAPTCSRCRAHVRKAQSILGRRTDDEYPEQRYLLMKAAKLGDSAAKK